MLFFFNGDDADQLIAEQGLNVEIPNIYYYIANEAFWGKGLKSIVIPDSVEWIGMRAFSQNQLTSVVIPDSVMYIM